MSWRVSRHSYGNGNCAEMTAGTAQWRKPRRSLGNGNCVEAGNAESVVVVRDTTDRRGGMLAFPAAAWTKFTDSLR